MAVERHPHIRFARSGGCHCACVKERLTDTEDHKILVEIRTALLRASTHEWRAVRPIHATPAALSISFVDLAPEGPEPKVIVSESAKQNKKVVRVVAVSRFSSHAHT